MGQAEFWTGDGPAGRHSPGQLQAVPDCWALCENTNSTENFDPTWPDGHLG